MTFQFVIICFDHSKFSGLVFIFFQTWFVKECSNQIKVSKTNCSVNSGLAWICFVTSSCPSQPPTTHIYNIYSSPINSITMALVLPRTSMLWHIQVVPTSKDISLQYHEFIPMLSSPPGFPWCSLGPHIIILSAFSLSLTAVTLPAAQIKGSKCCSYFGATCSFFGSLTGLCLLVFWVLPPSWWLTRRIANSSLECWRMLPFINSSSFSYLFS